MGRRRRSRWHILLRIPPSDTQGSSVRNLVGRQQDLGAWDQKAASTHALPAEQGSEAWASRGLASSEGVQGLSEGVQGLTERALLAVAGEATCHVHAIKTSHYVMSVTAK